MSILWTIIIGFVAGVIAKLLHPGNKYEPSGFIVTTPTRDYRSFCRNIPWPGSRVVSSWRGRGFHWSNRRRNHSTSSVGGNRSSPSADVGLIASHVAITCFAVRQQLGEAAAVTCSTNDNGS